MPKWTEKKKGRRKFHLFTKMIISSLQLFFRWPEYALSCFLSLLIGYSFSCASFFLIVVKYTCQKTNHLNDCQVYSLVKLGKFTFLCCAIITTFHLQNFLTLSTCKSVPIKQLLILPPQPVESAILFSGSMNLLF